MSALQEEGVEGQSGEVPEGRTPILCHEVWHGRAGPPRCAGAARGLWQPRSGHEGVGMEQQGHGRLIQELLAQGHWRGGIMC